MNEAAVPNQPSYMNRCRVMDFHELYLFIVESLEKHSNHDSVIELPRSEEKFQHLLEMLVEKADPAAPKRMSLTKGRELRSLYEKQERTKEFLEHQHNQPNVKKRKGPSQTRIAL